MKPDDDAPVLGGWPVLGRPVGPMTPEIAAAWSEEMPPPAPFRAGWWKP